MDLPPVDDMQAALAFAKAPAIYEDVLAESDAHSARVAVEGYLSGQGFDDVTVLTSGNVTAVIGYDAQTHSAGVAFDPTKTFKDKWDNFRRQPEDHPIGGEVHGGLYRGLIEPQSKFMDISLTDAIGGMLQGYAYQSDISLSVNFAGFSKGGGQAVIAAAEMIDQDIAKVI